MPFPGVRVRRLGPGAAESAEEGLGSQHEECIFSAETEAVSLFLRMRFDLHDSFSRRWIRRTAGNSSLHFSYDEGNARCTDERRYILHFMFVNPINLFLHLSMHLKFNFMIVRFVVLPFSKNFFVRLFKLTAKRPKCLIN